VKKVSEQKAAQAMGQKALTSPLFRLILSMLKQTALADLTKDMFFTYRDREKYVVS